MLTIFTANLVTSDDHLLLHHDVDINTMYSSSLSRTLDPQTFVLLVYYVTACAIVL